MSLELGDSVVPLSSACNHSAMQQQSVAPASGSYVKALSCSRSSSSSGFKDVGSSNGFKGVSAAMAILRLSTS
jgi:hypothetical protein